MRVESHPHFYQFRDRFPKYRDLDDSLHWSLYLAEQEGKYYIIHDQQVLFDLMQMTLPDFEEEEVPDLLQIYEFDSEQERGEYILRMGSNETKRKYQMSLVIQSLVDSENSAREGRFDPAAKILEDALQLLPERAHEIAGRGDAYHLFPSEFLMEHPIRGYALLARLARKAGEETRAREYLLRIEALDPGGSG